MSTGSARVKRVKEITNRLVAEAVRFRPDSAAWNWEVQVIHEPKVVNAFCMGGGKMGIYTGFWEKLNATDDEIAQVMGHEIGHALASHTREKMSVATATGAGVAILSAAVASQNRSNPSAFQSSYNTFSLAAALAITLPNSREAESEADQIGIELAARAGFDPRAAVSLWRKMAADSPERLEFFATHPSPENRIKSLEALVARITPLYEMAREGKPTTQTPVFVGVSKADARTDSVSRQAYAAKVANDGDTLTFISEDFEKFKRGETVLGCGIECTVGYVFQKARWKELHQKQSWRDLAVSVIKVGYINDLSYFMLGEAAKGLGRSDAAKAYYSRALVARTNDKTCDGAFNTCEGYQFPQVVEAALAR